MYLLCGILGITAAILSVRIYLIRKSAEELTQGIKYRLKNDTNTLISISCADKKMRALAGCINSELVKLSQKRWLYEAGDKEIRDAVTNISHDLRTPLTAISGYLELLKAEEMSPEAVRQLDIIRNRTEAMKQLTEEMFRFSVYTGNDENKNMLIYEKISLNSAIEEAVAFRYHELKKAGIEPNIIMPENAVYRMLNKKALVRILDNLVGNVIKYSDGDLRVELNDNGSIIFANHAENMDRVAAGKLFDRFYTVKTAKKSTGLGLSIAKSLTEQMNGSISSEYKDGELIITLNFDDLNNFSD